VLLSRSNADIQAIKNTYYQTFRRRLEDDIKGDLSGKTERHFLIVLGANRAEDAAPVVPQQIDADVQELYKATEGRAGTDEVSVCSILSTRNDNQIRAIAQSYQQKYSKTLEEVIKRVSFPSCASSSPTELTPGQEFSGHMEDALLFQLRNALDKYAHAATLLEDSMAGMGTKEKLLAARVVRFHWDRTGMGYIRSAYETKYRRKLAARIKEETSGDFEMFLLGCIGESV
jgi:annexin A7/11